MKIKNIEDVSIERPWLALGIFFSSMVVSGSLTAGLLFFPGLVFGLVL